MILIPIQSQKKPKHRLKKAIFFKKNLTCSFTGNKTGKRYTDTGGEDVEISGFKIPEKKKQGRERKIRIL